MYSGNADAKLTLSHTNFISGTLYTVSAGQDVANNPLDNAPYTWSFTTGAIVSAEYDIYLPLVTRSSGP